MNASSFDDVRDEGPCKKHPKCRREFVREARMNERMADSKLPHASNRGIHLSIGYIKEDEDCHYVDDG